MNRNRFDFLHIIGKGGFGKVWKVVDKKYKISYALKEMSKVKVIDKKSINSIKYERELLSRLHHPLIVNLHYAFQDFENLYLILDLLPGGDLRFHITRHKKRFFNESQTKFFICCIILALKYIHSNKIIHRDIKPENLVFDLKGFLHVTDFGIAKFFSANNSKETSGTPGYMAPEVMKGKNHTYAVDYFAVGVIAYELMMGKRPYVGKNKKEIREQIMSKQVFLEKNDVPFGWSDEAADFINKCLERKDVKRIGFENENEVFGHLWFKDVDWKGIERKKIFCPFEIDCNKENFDKKYCEGVDKIGVNTNNRYEDYKNNEKYNDLFHDFTFVNLNLEIKLNKNENKNIAIDSHRFKIQKSYSNNNMLNKNNNNNNNNNINYNNLILTHRHNVSNINREHKIRIPSANNVQRHQHYNSLNLNSNNNNNLNKRQLLLDGKITDNNKYLSHNQNLFSPIPKAKSKNVNIVQNYRKNHYSNEKINVNGNYYLSNNNNNSDITPLNKNNQTKIPISVRKLMRSNSHSNIYISNHNNTINYKNNNNNMNINNNNNYKPNKFIKNNNINSNSNNSNSNTINHKMRRKNIPNRPPISYREALRNINYNSLNNIKNNNNNNNINMLNNYMISKNNIENNIFYNKNNSSNGSFNYNNNNNSNKLKRKEFSINYANSQRHYYYHQDNNNNKSNNYYNNNYNKTYGFNMKKTSPFHSNYSTNATSTKKNYN